MKLRLSARGSNLSFENAGTLQTNFSSTSEIPEQSEEIALGSPPPLLSCRTDFLFAYDIFPPSIMRAPSGFASIVRCAWEIASYSGCSLSLLASDPA